MKISIKVSLIASLVVCGTFSSLSFYQYKVSEKNLKESIRNNINETTSVVSKQVSDWLNEKLLKIQMMSEISRDNNPQNIINVAVGKSEFQLLWFTNSENGHSVWNDDNHREMSIQDIRDRDWYKLAEQSSKPTFTDVYLDKKTNIPVISAVSTVMSDDGSRLKGVIGSDIETKEIVKILEKINFNGTGQIFIINKQGKSIIHPEKRYFGQYVSSVFSENISLTKLNVIQEGVFKSGTKVMVQYVPLAGVNNDDWMLGVAISKDKAFKSIVSLLTQALIGTLISVVICIFLIYYFMNRTIIKPITALTNAAVDISMGKQTDPVDAKYLARNDEIGKLAEGFERMRKSLNIAFAKISKTQKTKQEI